MAECDLCRRDEYPHGMLKGPAYSTRLRWLCPDCEGEHATVVFSGGWVTCVKLGAALLAVIISCVTLIICVFA